jgi:glycosyltransferase involved in cell wall biosynthesis
MLANASVNVYASDVDAEFYLRFFPGRRVAAVPNGVDLDYFQRLHSEDHLESESIVFEGSMMFPPNVDAAIRLCRDVLPRVKLQRPRARVILVGRDPVPAVRALAGEDVDVTGTVLDVRPYLACAAVFACPMELGSGIKNKILQAWASGLPVVATPESVGGLAARDGENILVRRSVADFAAAVIELLQDRERAAQLGRGGRKTVEREYSWRHSSESFERLLHQAFTG